MAKKRYNEDSVQDAVFYELTSILEKPRTSAHSPQALVEVCYALLNLAFHDRRHVRHMNNEYSSGSKAWYLDDSLDFGIVTARLKKLVEMLWSEME